MKSISATGRNKVTFVFFLCSSRFPARQPIQPDPIQSNPHQVNASRSNPIQSKSIRSNPIQFESIQSESESMQHISMESQPVQSNPAQYRPTQSNAIIESNVQLSACCAWMCGFLLPIAWWSSDTRRVGLKLVLSNVHLHAPAIFIYIYFLYIVHIYIYCMYILYIIYVCISTYIYIYIYIYCTYLYLYCAYNIFIQIILHREIHLLGGIRLVGHCWHLLGGPPWLASSRRPSLVTLCLVALPGYLAPLPSLMVCMPFAIVPNLQRKRHLWVLESFDFVADLWLRSSLLLALLAPPHAGTLFALRLFGCLLFALGWFAGCVVWGESILLYLK